MIDEFLMGVGEIEESDQFSKTEELKLYAKMRQTIKFEGFIPKCFDNEKQFKKWVERARVCSPLPPFSVCTDCTPEYKLEMMLQKRCENPHIDFVKKTTRADVKEGEGWMSYTFLEGEPNLERFEIYKKRGLAE